MVNPPTCASSLIKNDIFHDKYIIIVVIGEFAILLKNNIIKQAHYYFLIRISKYSYLF